MFAEPFTVYALDLPGFGYCDKPNRLDARSLSALVNRF